MSDPSVSPASSLPAGLAQPAFDANAMRVLKERYFAKKPDGTQETPTEFLWRVASSIALPERPFAEKAGKNAAAVIDGVGHAFYDMMCARDFLPNTPCLVNAGRPLSMLSACFVLPVPDSIEGIFYNLKAMALIQKSGGGTGFSFSDLRHQGAEVFSTGKDASGPVSFMKVFNAATDSIKQGGVRRGANMGVLRVDHPDVYHFMSCKKELDAENRALWNRMSDTGRYSEAQLAHMKQELLQTQINNFNISIGVTDAFMTAVKSDGDFDLRDPRTKDESARDLGCDHRGCVAERRAGRALPGPSRRQSASGPRPDRGDQSVYYGRYVDHYERWRASRCGPDRGTVHGNRRWQTLPFESARLLLYGNQAGIRGANDARFHDQSNRRPQSTLRRKRWYSFVEDGFRVSRRRSDRRQSA
jgi:ribonucleotide reductase alpha subunit